MPSRSGRDTRGDSRSRTPNAMSIIHAHHIQRGSSSSRGTRSPSSGGHAPRSVSSTSAIELLIGADAGCISPSEVKELLAKATSLQIDKTSLLYARSAFNVMEGSLSAFARDSVLTRSASALFAVWSASRIWSRASELAPQIHDTLLTARLNQLYQYLDSPTDGISEDEKLQLLTKRLNETIESHRSGFWWAQAKMGLAALTSAASAYFGPSFYTAGACAFNTGLDLPKLANGGLGKVGIEELDKYPLAMPVYR